MNTIIIKTKTQYNKLPKSFEEETIVQILCNLDNLKEIKNCIYSISGYSHIVNINGNIKIESIDGYAKIDYISDHVKINKIDGNVKIDYISDHVKIHTITGDAMIRSIYSDVKINFISYQVAIDHIEDNVKIGDITNRVKIDLILSNVKINHINDNVMINSCCGATRNYHCTINHIGGNAVINDVTAHCTINHVYGNAIIRIFSKGIKIIRKEGNPVLIYHNCKPKKVKDKSIICINTQPYTLKLFCDIYKDNMISETEIKLYKSINPNTYCDFHTGKIKYVGQVICPDWNPNPNIECGNGLHLSPTPELALSYNKGKIIECIVNINDIAIYGTDITKVRCKKVLSPLTE